MCCGLLVGVCFGFVFLFLFPPRSAPPVLLLAEGKQPPDRPSTLAAPASGAGSRGRLRPRLEASANKQTNKKSKLNKQTCLCQTEEAGGASAAVGAGVKRWWRTRCLTLPAGRETVYGLTC